MARGTLVGVLAAGLLLLAGVQGAAAAKRRNQRQRRDIEPRFGKWGCDAVMSACMHYREPWHASWRWAEGSSRRKWYLHAPVSSERWSTAVCYHEPPLIPQAP